MKKKLKICIAFFGNAFLDSRVTNLRNSLIAEGHEVKVISFDWMTENFETVRGDVSVFKLKKRKFSLLFYLSFAARLKLELFKCKADVYFAEEIFTLPFVTFFGKLHGGKVYYNSRELYAFLGGLRNRKKLQSAFYRLEKFFIKKVDLVLTTGEMDSEFIEEFYGVKETVVIRNIPLLAKPTKKIDLRKELGIPNNSVILLYQGVMIDGRGLDLIFDILPKLKNAALVLLGDGVKRKRLEEKAEKTGVANRVFFLGMKPQNELLNYTAAADIGLSLIENISKSYYYALPNKLFEYIMGGLPVVVSDLPQMKNIVETYKVGEVVNLDKPDAVLSVIQNLIDDKEKVNKYKENCSKAAEELNWQREYERARDRLFIFGK